MLTQECEAGTSNVQFPKRVAVIDFSEYQVGGDILGHGAGIAIYEWPALAAFNINSCKSMPDGVLPGDKDNGRIRQSH